MGRLLHIVLALFLTTIGVGAQSAEPAQKLSVEVVLDSSGSMLDNDPGRLSVFAGMIFLDLLGDESRLGFQTMRRQGYTLSALGDVKSSRARVRRELGGLVFSGGTDCAGPLAASVKSLQGEKAQRAVVFLSDGICINRPHQVAELDQATQALRDSGIQAFSVGLFDDAAVEKEDPEKDLKFIAATSGGEYFRALKPDDLPRIFSTILGRLVGSEAQSVKVDGNTLKVDVDGYVIDAALILTSVQKPVRLTRGTGPAGDLKLPVKSVPYEAATDEYFVSAQGNQKGAYYTVLRLKNPTAGAWEFVVDGGQGVQGLLIQNFGLNPVVVVGNGPLPAALSTSSTTTAGIALLDLKGEPIKDVEFLRRVSATLSIKDPKGEKRDAELVLDESTGRLVTSLQPLVPGVWHLDGRARMKSGLNKSTKAVSFEAQEALLALGAGQGAIDFGVLKAGETSPSFEIDLSGSKLLGDLELTVDLPLEHLSAASDSTVLTPQDLEARVMFSATKEHPGGVVTGNLQIVAGGLSVLVPVKGTIEALTFWERWGEMITKILVGLLLLLFMIFILHGIMSPHDFPAEARINWGNSLDRLDKNRSVIREIAGARRGFRRNAQLRIGGPKSFLASGGESAVIEAVGENQMVITAASGAEIRKVNKFDPTKDKVVEGGTCPIHTGEIFKVGDLFLRVQ